MMRRLLTFLVLVVARLLAKLPAKHYAFWGSILGKGLSVMARKRACLVRHNLALTLPERSEQARQIIFQQHFAHLGMGLLEMLNIWFAKDRTPLNLIEQARVTGLAHWQDIAGKQGVILCVFHHTHIEAMGLLLGQLGQVHPVYRPQDNLILEDYGAKARSRWTAGAVSNRNVRQMVRLLKQKETLWLAPDQRNRSDGVPIPFMGQNPLTHLSIARLARLTDAQIIPVTCHRAEDSVLALTFHPALQGMTEKTDEALLTELMLILEQEVRAYPEQYFWVHDRFNIGRQRC
jgi:KDO2-lipid IV(A) lauroyltransferase